MEIIPFLKETDAWIKYFKKPMLEIRRNMNEHFYDFACNIANKKGNDQAFIIGWIHMLFCVQCSRFPNSWLLRDTFISDWNQILCLHLSVSLIILSGTTPWILDHSVIWVYLQIGRGQGNFMHTCTYMWHPSEGEQ